MPEQRTPAAKLRRARLERTACMVCLVVVAVGSIVQRWIY